MAAAETYSSSSLEAAQSYAQGQELQWSGKWDEAIKAYERAVQIDPNLGRAYTGLAVAHDNLGQRQEAGKYFQLAMAKVDRMSERERYRTYGAYYLAMRNDQKAIEQFSALIKQFPADDAGRTNLALAYFFNRNIPRAIEEGRLAVEINKKNLLYRNNLALYAMYGGQFDDAIREAGEVLKLDAGFRKAYVAMALAQLAQGKTAEAEAAYHKLEGVSARGASLASIGLADMALYDGRNADAIGILEKGIAADLAGSGGAAAAAIKLAAVAAARRNRAQALEAANRALATGKPEGAAFAAARVLLESGQEAKALAVAAEMGARLEPEPQAYAKLLEGEAQLAKGKAREAIRPFQEAQKLADTWLGRLDLGRAYLESGAYTEASAELGACIKRKGEATAVFFDDVPTYRYFPPVYYYLARAQEGLKSPGAAESYKTFLTIKAKADVGDPMVADAQKRAKVLMVPGL
jgi:tetratricopeptide (TPR) repeat protein